MYCMLNCSTFSFIFLASIRVNLLTISGIFLWFEVEARRREDLDEAEEIAEGEISECV